MTNDDDDTASSNRMPLLPLLRQESEQSKNKSKRRQSNNSSSSSRPGSPDPVKTPHSEKVKSSKSSSRLRSSASSGNLAGDGQREGGATSAGGAAGPAIVLDDPQAAYVLVATCEYLRLYPINHVVAGDRTVAKRVHLPGPLLFASCFAAAGGPALAVLVGQGGEVALQVYTLPGLELLSSGSLSAAAGWPWEWDGRHSAGRLPHVIAATRHGHLALLGPNSELARFALWSRAAAPAPPVSTYDWDMAAAAQAAVTAFEQMKAFSKAQAASSAASRGGPGAGAAAAGDAAGRPAQLQETQQQQGMQELGEEGGEGVGGGRRGGVQMPKDFKGFMTKIGQDFQRAGGEVAKGFQKALDETQKGLQKVAQVFEEDLSGANRPNAKGLPREDASYPHPTLAALFDCSTPGTLHLRTSAAAATSSTSDLDEEASPRGVVPTDFTSGSSTSPMSKVRSARQSLSPRSTRRTTEMVPAATAAAAAAASGLTATSRSPVAGRSSRLLGGEPDAARAALFEGAGTSSSAARQGGTSSNSSGAAVARLGAAGPSGAARGAAAAGGGPTKVRTAEEIRQAYGRAPLQKTYEIRNVMEENQQKLAERGEKLSRLQDKAGDLTETAAGFAEMAKLLKEREKQKSKWF